MHAHRLAGHHADEADVAELGGAAEDQLDDADRQAGRADRDRGEGEPAQHHLALFEQDKVTARPRGDPVNHEEEHRDADQCGAGFGQVHALQERPAQFPGGAGIVRR